MEMTFDDLPKEVMDIAIGVMIAANPTLKLSRADWVECIEGGYDVKKTDSDIVLEPKRIINN